MRATFYCAKASVLVLMLSLTACYQTAREYNNTQDLGSGKELQPAYGLVSPQAIIDSMTNANGLALSTNNESVVDIRNRRIDLGDADPANRVARNPKPSAGKFKIILENYINACSDSVGFNATPSADQLSSRTRLFSGGGTINESSFDTLYLTFLGRLPSGDERAVLMELAATVSADSAFASACAAVTASLEALNGQ